MIIVLTPEFTKQHRRSFCLSLYRSPGLAISTRSSFITRDTVCGVWPSGMESNDTKINTIPGEAKLYVYIYIYIYMSTWSFLKPAYLFICKFTAVVNNLHCIR